MKVAICEDDRIQAGQLENYLKERLKKTQTKYDIDVYFSVDDIKKIENDIIKYDLIKTENLNKVINEINKCIVLCANCHRKLHN